MKIRLGLRFVPFPGPSSSGVWRAQSLRLITFPVSAAQFSGCIAGIPTLADDDSPEPQEVLVSKEVCLHFCLSWAAIAPFQPLWLWLPVTGGGWSTAGYFCSILCSVHSPGGVLCSSFSRGSYPTVWLHSWHSGPILKKHCSPPLPAQPPLASGRCRRLRWFSAVGVTVGLVICWF